MTVLLIILKILLYLLLLTVGFALLLLLLPFSYSGQVLTAEGFSAKVALGWAWKLLGINAEIEGDEYDITFRVFKKKVYTFKNNDEVRKDTNRKPEEKEKKKTEKRGFDIKELADKALLNEIIEYIKSILNIVRPKYIHLYGTFGFDDPSVTGIICGAAGIIKGIIPNARVSLTPDFSQEILDLDFYVQGSMAAGSLVYRTIRTVFKKPVRKVLFKKKKT